jgi:hypothetical protein
MAAGLSCCCEYDVASGGADHGLGCWYDDGIGGRPRGNELLDGDRSELGWERPRSCCGSFGGGMLVRRASSLLRRWCDTIGRMGGDEDAFDPRREEGDELWC